MKVLITGATGLVGQAIVKLLHGQGIAVNYLTTNESKIKSSENYQGFYWNPSSQEIDMACFQGVDAIINLAGASIAQRWTENHMARILDSRINSLNTLHKGLAQLNSINVKSFITASAIGIYPDSLTHFYDEKETSVDASFVGEVVKKWEISADQFKNFDFKVAKIRIGIVLSTEGGALPKIATPIQNYVGASVGTGEQWQSWIHIDDLAEMFLFAMKNQLGGVFNGVSPNPVTNSKLTKELAHVLDRPLWLPHIPKFVLKTFLGEMSYLLFASQRVSSKKIEKQGFVFQYPNLGLALKHLYVKNGDGETSSVGIRNEFVQ